jgi:hypothetical protein
MLSKIILPHIVMVVIESSKIRKSVGMVVNANNPSYLGDECRRTVIQSQPGHKTLSER